MKKIVKKIIICLIIITTYLTYFAESSMATTSLSQSDSYKYQIKKLSTHVPQGLCKVTIGSTTYRLITAYNYSNSSKGSILEVYTNSGSYKGYIFLRNASNSKITGHVGGITVSGNWIVIVSTSKVYTFKKSALTTAISHISAIPSMRATKTITYSTSSYGNASFCTTDIDGSVWIGNYNSKSSSYAYRFTLNTTSGALSYSSTKISIPSHVQGMAFTENGKKVAFAASNGSKGSYVYIYKVSRNSKNKLTKTSSKKSYKTMYCGIENIYFTSSNNLYAVFESAAVGYSHKPTSSSYAVSSYVRLLKTSSYI